MIIEASKYLSNSKDDNLNGQWQNIYQQPILLNKGDVVSIKNIFIDSSNNNSQNITLNEDVHIDLEMGYYYVNSEDGGNRKYHGIDGDDKTEYANYIARNKDNDDPVLKSKSIIIPKGNYTPAYLVEYMNRELTKIDFHSTAPGTGTGIKSENPFLIRTDDLGIYPVDGNGDTLPKMFFLRQDQDVNTSENDRKYFQFAVADGAGVYTNDNYNVGASQVEFSWNRDANGLFSLDYIHTPLMDGSNEIVEIRQRDAGDFHMYVRRSGVFFTKIESTNDFLDTVMGFDTANMVYAFDGNKKLEGNLDDDMGKRTTGGYLGLINMLKSDNSSMAAKIDDNKTHTGGATTSIEAVKQYNPEVDGGFVLLSISGFQGDYHQDEQTRNNIRAIVSRQYSANSYITSFGGAGIDYLSENNQIITNLKIEILDPKTREPINNLGPNSSVFLEVQRA